MENNTRVNYAQLYAYAQRLKENPGVWEPIPTRGKHPDRVVVRQRKGLIPALLPEEGFISKQVNYVAMGCFNPPAED